MALECPVLLAVAPTHKVSRPSRKRHLAIWWLGGFLPKRAGAVCGTSVAPANEYLAIDEAQVLAGITVRISATLGN
jgi:hypothetical protein